MPRMSALSLEGLRSTIRPEYARLPAEDLERVIESSISGLPAGTVEDFMSTLSSFGKSAAPVLQRAAPDVAQGAATGATFGPYGALIGAGAGLASSLIKSQDKPAPAPSRPPAPAASAPPPSTAAPMAPVTSPPPQSSSTSAAPAAPTLPTGQGAAATILSLLQNPTVQQALLSQVLGSAGGQQVPTGSGTSIPRGVINSLLTQLLANASEALPESESISEQTYLQDASGEYLVDPASLDQHAALVLSHLQRRSTARVRSDTDDWIGEDVGEVEVEEWPDVVEGFETVSFF
jgi:hypothetical protein